MAANKDTFLRWWQAVRPRWLSQFYGERFVGLFALLADASTEAARQLVGARFIGAQSPESYIVRTGIDRGLPRYPDEPIALYRARMRDHWEGHRLGSTFDGLVDLFAAAGYEAFPRFTTWPKYEIVVFGYSTQPCTSPVWSSSGSLVWGSFVWGTTLPLAVAKTLKEIAQDFLPAICFFEGFACPTPEDALTLSHRWLPTSDNDWTDQVGSEDLTGTGVYAANDVRFNGEEAARGTWTGSVTLDVQQAFVYAVAYDPLTTTAVTRDAVVFGGSDTKSIIFQDTSNDWAAENDGAVVSSGESAATAPSRAHVLIVVYDVDEIRFYKDGALVSASSEGVPRAFDGSVTIGGGTSGPVVAEVGVGLGAPTLAQVEKLSRACRDLYGVPYEGTAAPAHPKTPDLWETVTWAAGTPTSGELALASWMTYRCETSGTTIQTSASTLATGFAADAARGYSTDGTTWYLAVEPGAVNLVSSQDFSTYTQSGTVPVSSAAGPDGVSGDYTLTDDAAGVVELRFLAVTHPASSSLRPSFWAKHDGGSGEAVVRDSSTDGTSYFVQVPDTATSWAYYNTAGTGSGTTSAGSSDNIVLTPRRFPADTGACSFAFLQVEARAYSTSYYDGTRVAGALKLSTDEVAPFGYFDLDVIALVPASTAYSGDATFFDFDEDSRLWYDESSGEIVLQVNGSELVRQTASWSAGELRLRAISLPSGSSLFIGDTEYTGSRGGKVSPRAWVYLGGDELGADESFFPRYVQSKGYML